jgi:hypothetical protein
MADSLLRADDQLSLLAKNFFVKFRWRLLQSHPRVLIFGLFLTERFGESCVGA